MGGWIRALPEISTRLERLRTETGLSEAELWIARTLAEAFRAGLDRILAELPPSRRTSPDFWEDKPDWFAERASRTGRELLGLGAGPEEQSLLGPEGRLLTSGIVRRFRSGVGQESPTPKPPPGAGPLGRTFTWSHGSSALSAGPPNAILAASYTLTATAARRLFADLPGIDPDLPAIGIHGLTASEAQVAERGAAEPGASTAPHSLVPAPPAPRDPDATPEEALFDVREPEFGFDDVVLPAETLREIRTALVQIRKHPLLVERWGVGERYRMGRGLAFNFAGPPGTGKSLTAEAVARELGRPLMTVKYSGVESKWIGETGKHIAAVFAAARREQAVLFFDEADAIASRRTANLEGSARHYNLTVNILLHELERYEGVVIFATNLAANFDPAFERRIQSHVLFRMPDAAERERIWRAHLPPRAPLAPDVDLRHLAEAFEIAGGDIRNAVLKAVHLAALEDAPDERLCITQEHLLAAARAILHARAVMAQSILARPGSDG